MTAFQNSAIQFRFESSQSPSALGFNLASSFFFVTHTPQEASANLNAALTVKLKDYFFKSNDATLHLTNH